jgi:Flp pilus assembly protein TadG
MKTRNPKNLLKTFRAFAKDRSGGAAIVMGVAMPVVLGGLAFGSELAF